MASQFDAVMVHQVYIIGKFFDAKHQLETQRIFQTMMSLAHKDYMPSEGICEIGTNVRSLATSQRRGDLVKLGYSKRVMDRQMRTGQPFLSTAGNCWPGRTSSRSFNTFTKL